MKEWEPTTSTRCSLDTSGGVSDCATVLEVIERYCTWKARVIRYNVMVQRRRGLVWIRVKLVITEEVFNVELVST